MATVSELKELPGFLQDVIKKYPKVWESYKGLGAALSEVDGLDRKTQQMVKLGIAVGAGSEGAVHSHAKRCKAEGFSDEEIYHAAMLAATTIGWPRAVAALSWINDVLKELRAEAK
jgi:alkylhydroperoxidase/carboxymuconolactone decarboxylase family protein YurZ